MEKGSYEETLEDLTSHVGAVNNALRDLTGVGPGSTPEVLVAVGRLRLAATAAQIASGRLISILREAPRG